MSRLSQADGFEVAVASAAACGLVGGFGVPAGRDDAQPGAGEDADGVRVPAAASACFAVDPFGGSEGVRWPGRAPQPEAGQACLAKPGRALGCRVALEEAELIGDLPWRRGSEPVAHSLAVDAAYA